MSENGSESLDEVVGVVLDVLFDNPDTGYAVLRLQVRGEERSVNATGTLYGMAVGARVRLFGRYHEHARFGRQLRVERHEEIRPSSRQGMVGYLASQFPGVGEKTAERIVDTFGDETYDVLDADPDRVLTVKGLGRKKAKELAKQWRERRGIREAATFLLGYGVKAAHVQRVFRHYGDDTVSLVKSNPFRLADEVRGIGFRTADRIAQSLGMPKDARDRSRAGLLFLMSEAGGRGHVLMPVEELVARAVALEITMPAARDGLADLIEQRELILCDDAPTEPSSSGAGRWSRRGPAVYLPRSFTDECAVAQILAEMVATRRALPDAEREIRKQEQRAQLALADGQRSALVDALSRRVSVITGGPGVGKTTIIRLLVDTLLAHGAEVSLAAPTGRAARRLADASGAEASTVHRLLHYDPILDAFLVDEGQPLEVDHLVVDECSMMDLGLAAALLRALPEEASLTLVGDADQLPSVGPGDFFRAICAAQGMPVNRLTEVFRQRDGSRIIGGAHAILHGAMPEFDPVGPGGELYFVERDDPDHVAELIRTLVVERIPAVYGLDPRRDVQVLTPMHKGAAGAENLNRILGLALNPDPPASVERAGKTWRVGDRVVQVKNDYKKNVFNGDQGTIADIDTRQSQCLIRFDGADITYPFEDLAMLLPAWAITVHRAQGGEHKAVVLALTRQHHPLLQRNLVYTAITRAKQLCVIVGNRGALQRAIDNEGTHDRYSWLEERLTRRIRELTGAEPRS